LSILYDQWSPALTCQSVCLSIQSMLASCTEKVLIHKINSNEIKWNQIKEENKYNIKMN